MIEAANHLPYNPQETNYTKISQEEIQREVDYVNAGIFLTQSPVKN